MAGPEDEQEDAFMTVQKMDAEFKMQAAQQQLDPLVEANALLELMKGGETIFHTVPSTKYAAACITATRLCRAKWISREHACERYLKPNSACEQVPAAADGGC